VHYTSEGDLVVEARRDYMGALTAVTLADRQTGGTEAITDPALLKKLDIIEEEVSRWE
jgi:hypothetical protein